MFDSSLDVQQDHYRYNPVTLTPDAGPARIFPHKGDEGILRYIIEAVEDDLLREAKLPSAIADLLENLDNLEDQAEEWWLKLTTALVDLEIFQSNFFNHSVPDGEQFSSDFIRLKKDMGEALLAAKKAADRSGDDLATRRRAFYAALKQHDRTPPAIAELHERDGGLTDRQFAWQRIAGPNPMTIARVQDRSVLQGMESTCQLSTGETVALADLAAQNRLFSVSYPLLDLAEDQLHVGRYVGNPKAFFYRSDRGLEPIAIQLQSGGKLHTPHDSKDDWMRAKLYVQVSDVTQHELITHLCFTHLSMEAFAIATPRQLLQHHPLHRLLRPHFKFLLAINTRGNAILLGEQAAIENLMAPTRSVALSMMDQAYRSKSFADHAFPIDLIQRGIEPEFLPDFPYRDDAQLLWNAIAQYVTAYLSQYYRSDEDVVRDASLQAWAAELGSPIASRSSEEFAQAPDWLPDPIAAEAGLLPDLPSYARVPDFPSAQTPGQFASLSQLINVTTQIIFTCSAQHAAVNFSQFDYFGYVPNAPMAAYMRPDIPGKIEHLLPPLEKDLAQIELTFALSGIHWSQLGSSDIIEFDSDRDRAILNQFQTELEQIGMTIVRRNAQRKHDFGIDYPYLHPTRIPNSINI